MLISAVAAEVANRLSRLTGKVFGKNQFAKIMQQSGCWKVVTKRCDSTEDVRGLVEKSDGFACGR